MKNKAKYLTLMIIYFGVIRVASNMHSALIPEFVRSLTSDPAVYKMYNSYMMMALSIGSLSMAVTWGKITDKMGPKKTLMIATVLFCIFQYGLGFATTILLAVFARFGVGATLSGIIVAANTYLVALTDNTSRDKALAINSGLSTILVNISILIGGYLSIYGVKITFLIEVLLLFAAMVLFSVLIPEPVIEKVTTSKSGEKANISFKELFKLYKAEIITVIGMVGLGSLIANLYGTTFNGILSYDYGYAPKEISQFSFSMGMITSCVMIAYSFLLAKKYPAKKIVAKVMMVAFVALVAFILSTFTNNFLLSVAILTVLRTFAMLGTPLFYSLASTISTVNKAKILSLITLMESVGMLLGTFISPKLSMIDKYAPYYFGLIPLGVMVVFAFLAQKQVAEREKKGTVND